MNKVKDPYNDFQVKLVRALKLSGFVVPDGEQFNELSQEVEEIMEQPKFSNKQLSDLFNKRYGLKVVSEVTFDEIKRFLIFLSEKYTEFNTGRDGGMTTYISENKIDVTYRSILVKTGYLLTNGGKIDMQYKWSGAEVTDDFIYSVILDVKNFKKETKRERKFFTNEEYKFIHDLLKEGVSPNMISNSEHPELSTHSKATVLAKAKVIAETIKNPEVGTITSKVVRRGKIPGVSSKVKPGIFDDKNGTAWGHFDILYLKWACFYGLGNKPISKTLNRTTLAVASQKKAMKSKGELEIEMLKSYLAKHLNDLEEIFYSDLELKQLKETREQNQQEEQIETENNQEITTFEHQVSTLDQQQDNTGQQVLESEQKQIKENQQACSIALIDETKNQLIERILILEENIKKKEKKQKNKIKKLENKVDDLNTLVIKLLTKKL